MPHLNYLRTPISNGNALEQALIRWWWCEARGGGGRLVWEYYLGGPYADAIVFLDSVSHEECGGRRTPARYPLANQTVVVCEAKKVLTCELIGQALVYRALAKRAGARVQATIVLAEEAGELLTSVAQELELVVVVPSTTRMMGAGAGGVAGRER